MRTTRTRVLRAISAVAIVSLLLVACGNGGEEDPPAPQPEEAADEPEADDEADEPEPDPDSEDEAGDADDAADEEVDRSQYALAEPFEVTVGAIPGAQSFVVFTMMDQGIHTDYNLEFDLAEVLSPPALHTAVAEKAVDIGFAGITAAIQARAQGRETVIFGMLSSPNNLVLTPTGSGIESLDDLRGERWGTFSGQTATTFQILEALILEQYGWSLRDETEFVEAPDPALAGLMGQGEIVAALHGGVGSLSVYLDGGFDIVSDLSEDWIELFGALPGHVAIASNDPFAEEHPEVLVAFMAAYQDTIEYIENNPDVWQAFADDIELDADGAAEALQERLATRLIGVWDEAQLQAQEDLIQLLIEVTDEGDFVTEVPEGMFRLDLQPGRWDG